jgi:hypothetical protein
LDKVVSGKQGTDRRFRRTVKLSLEMLSFAGRF